MINDLKPLIVPPLAKEERLVVDPKIWEQVIETINNQSKLINELNNHVDKIIKSNNLNQRRIKILAEAIGGVYEDEE